MSIVNEKKSELNEKQLEAVNTVKGPVVIIAGPGTGKTKTLVERTVNILVNEKVEAKKIMITTFTNKAARELELRINESLEKANVNIDISDMYIGTMHSIWTRLIEENITYSDFFDNFELMSGDYEQHFFIYSRLKEYKKLEDYQKFFDNLSNNTGKYQGDWARSSFLKNKINDLNENAIDIENIQTSDVYINFIKEAYKLYVKQLYEANIVDFSYLQVEFFNMLVKNKEFLEKINHDFEYIMVDEYQDSNKIQEKILLLISKTRKNICVVGDEDQSIYRFRGASSENILNFPKHFDEDECKIIILEENYRSVTDIVEFNNKWISSIDWQGNRFDKNIVSMRDTDILGKNVFHISGKTMDENIKNTVIFIKKLKQHNKITNYNQIAVLFANFKNNSAKKLEVALKKENIEVYSPRTKVFFEMYEIKLTLGIILACFKKYFPEDSIDQYLTECIDFARLEIKKDSEFLAWIKEKIENISEESFDSLNEIFYEFLNFTYYKNVLNEETPVDSRANHNLAILSKIFKNFQKYVHYRKITAEDDFSVVKYFFTGYLDILKESRVDEIFSEEDYPNECIPFLTIHQSKGLEFPVVIVFSLNSKPNRYEDDDISRQTSIDRLINSSSKLSENDKEKFDFYRKFYVAFSRAKNLLVLSSYEMGISENFKPFFYSIRGVNSLQFDINEVNLDEVTKKDERKILSYTTDIAPYRHCPMKYYLVREKEYSTFSKKIFNLGIITHKAIEHINKLFLQKKNPLFDDEYIENLLKNIYKFQNIDLDDNFERIMSIVKKYIEDEKDNFEYIKKVEASEFRIEDDYILYGQIDLILEDENEIQIIDFKTGKYNELEYSSNYRQQLSLYKLLLQKKYDKDIKTYLYYLEEDEPKKEILITDEELEEDFKNINKTTQDILDNKFPKIPYNHNICGICEFKNYCWGLE